MARQDLADWPQFPPGWLMKGWRGRWSKVKVSPEDLLVAHTVPRISRLFTLRTFPSPRVPQGCRSRRCPGCCVPSLQSSQLGSHAQARTHAPDVVVAEEPPPVLVLGTVVHPALSQTIQSFPPTSLFLILLREQALLALPACLVLVSPECDRFLLLFWTRISVQFTVLVASCAELFVSLAIEKVIVGGKEKQTKV